MPFRMPEKLDVYQFALENNAVEKIPITYNDVQTAAESSGKHPHAKGTLLALSYLITLVDKQDFPARPPESISNQSRSNQALYWLKETHAKLLTPLLNCPLNQSNQDGVKQYQIGTYRTIPASNTVTPAPPPQLIPAILHNWIIDISTLHQKIKGKLDVLHGIDRNTYRTMQQITNDCPLFFSTTQPFSHANNRLGRIVANALRIAWRIPFVTQVTNNYEEFKHNLEDYQSDKLANINQKARELKF